jgi:hypothetical protein
VIAYPTRSALALIGEQHETPFATLSIAQTSLQDANETISSETDLAY